MDEAFQTGHIPPSHLPASQWKDVVLWILRQRKRFRITGNSMQPLLQPQEEVLINPRAYQTRMPQPGDLVVINHPHQSNLRLIKWVVYVDTDGCFVKGLNLLASTDSREFGLVKREHLVGKVLCRFP